MRLKKEGGDKNRHRDKVHRMARIATPFSTVGIFPFILGTVLAWRLGSSFNINTLILSMLGIALVMLATYHAKRISRTKRMSVQGVSFGTL